jgi:hypothetical protein
MSQMLEGPRKTFIASETGGPNLRWYISDASTNPPTVSICGSTDPSVGVNEAAVLVASDRVALLLANAQGTRKMLAAGAITGGNKLYAAADGEVASSGTLLEGLAFETTTADQDILEVMGAFGEDVDEDWADDELLEFGTGDDAIIMWSTGDASNHAVVVGIGDTSQQIHITDKAARATDWARTAGTHPELAIHSNTTPATDYLAIGNHDGTTATIDVVGGTTLNVDIDGTTALAVVGTTTEGSGITGVAESFGHSVVKIGAIFHTTIVIDLTGLNSGGTADDIIGDAAAANCHIGQITAARNGTIFGIRMTCLETPATGDDDIDLWSAEEDTGTEDTLITSLTNQVQLTDGGNLTAGTVVGMTAPPVTTHYLYLAGKTGDANATYTAGKLVIEMWGK